MRRLRLVKFVTQQLTSQVAMLSLYNFQMRLISHFYQQFKYTVRHTKEGYEVTKGHYLDVQPKSPNRHQYKCLVLSWES